ncbi:MAG: DUF294 nucleotidyltransferase-like domain-containing protein [Desulfomonilaceae bacterium]|nr:DUF294 nucleotidyltransferase-like domain-containing protein [Desulfomonilaceae bacterium]
MGSNEYSTVPRMLLDFLGKTLPFTHLDSGELERLSRHCLINFFPKGSIIFRQNVSEVTHLCLVQKGGVKVYFQADETVATLKDYGGEGAAIGALSIVRGDRADLTVEAVEDTFCLMVEKGTFLDLVRRNPRVARFYLHGLSEDVICDAYSVLRSQKMRARKEEALYLFNTRIQALIRTQPAIVATSATIREAGGAMADRGIGSVLVRNPSGCIVGIVTDRDLRKAVARGLEYDLTVDRIMASPVRTISAQSDCFDALLRIIRDGYDHLVVEHRKQILGVVTAHDIMAYQGGPPLYLFRDIAAEKDMESLFVLSEKVPAGVRTLIEEGAQGRNISRVITLLNDCIVGRILDLLIERLGPPPVNFCWLSLGSDGREEQTFRTDQDNAIIYQDPEEGTPGQAAEDYFRTLGHLASEHLIACGYPRCKSDFMASNPRWCKPYSVWVNYFHDWVASPEPTDTATAAIFFDFRPVYGEVDLGYALRRKVSRLAERQHSFLNHLAADCLHSWPPLSFFRNFIVEKNGEHKNRLDLKKRGLSPIVNFARLMALRYGIEETNTLDRMRIMAETERISGEFYADAGQAYEFQIQLNLVHQLEMVEAGLVPDSFIDPADLSDVERNTLKEAFSVIDRMLAHIKRAFPSVL